ncbi:MAG TPA: signal peptidase I [Candidatus Intestinimonas pullistercoris]|uniref:Signal peptidase I n=1 Tax=Candidatus Intestinimonas pullistercoris TaxID=2838623 RepID=A0A9D2NYM2_9FIRM|nr:signal peptidase I [Candidatus Intestinimonas pullistercoris]
MEEPEEEEAALSGADAFKVDLYFWLQALVMALVGLILIFTFVGRIIGVDGESMMPTLHNRDMLLLQSIGYSPEQGDVVVLSTKNFRNGSPIVKRIIAVGGQTVDIDYETNTVYVDGVALDEPYILETMRALPESFATHVEVPEGSIFVMGDNRNNSTDSRSPELGVVDQRCVLGKALFILLPFQDAGAIESISRPR